MAGHDIIGAPGRPLDSTRAGLARTALKHRALACGRLVAVPLSVAVLLFVCFATWSIWRFGSWTDGIAYLNGAALTADQATLHLGDVRVGEQAEGVFVLKNLWDEPITVLGATADCSCVTTADVPLQVAPGVPVYFETRLIPTPNEANQTATHQILLHLNVDAPAVVLTLVANVRPAERQSRQNHPSHEELVKAGNDQ